MGQPVVPFFFPLSSVWVFAILLQGCLGRLAKMCQRLNVYMHDGEYTCWLRWIGVNISCLSLPVYVCHFVYMCWCLCLMALGSVCVPVGVAREPQFLYGPICFVLFVLLINEIRGAACWDGPACTATLDRPTFSWACLCFPNEYLLFLPVLSHFHTPFPLTPPSIDLTFYSFFFYFCFPVCNTGGSAGPREVTIGRRLV